jgi:hypothetical protein
MPRFVQGIKIKPARRGGDRTGQVAGRLVGRGQSVQDTQYRPFHRDGPAGAPVIEVRAVAQVEAGEERTTGQLGSRREGAPPIGAGQSLELREVDPDTVIGERDPAAIDENGVATSRGAEGRQRPAQRAAGCRIVRVRPEQGSQLIASERAPLGTEQGQDGDRLARVDDKRQTIHQDLRRTEQTDVEARWGLGGHDVTVPILHDVP